MTRTSEKQTVESPLVYVVSPEYLPYDPEALESLSIQQVDPFTYYASLGAAKIGLEQNSDWQQGKKFFSPHQRIRELQERLNQDVAAYVMVVGGGATATAAIDKLLEKAGGQNIVIVHIYDPKDLTGQTKKIDINIHHPESNQKNAVKAFSSPILSLGERLSEGEIGAIAQDLGIDFIIDARGLTAQDEKKLMDQQGQPLEYGVDHKTLASREIIDIVHHAQDELAQGRPEAMIALYHTLDLENVVISGAGKVGTQDLVTKVRLLQVGQKVYRETGRLIDFQKFASKEKDSFSVNLKRIGLTTSDLGKVTVVNRSLPRIIDAKPEHQADAFINIQSDPGFKSRRLELYHKIVELESSSPSSPLPPNTGFEIAKRYYQQQAGLARKDAYDPVMKKLKKETKDLLNSFFSEEEIRKHSPKFIKDTRAELKTWQNEFGFDFIEGLIPNHYDSYTGAIGFDNQLPNNPTSATLLLSALGVNKYDYPETWAHTAGAVAGMRAIGSGNISTSVQHVKGIIKSFLSNIQGNPKKTVAQNQTLLTHFESLLSTYNEGNPLEAMVAHSPWILIKDWLYDPITSTTLTDFNQEIRSKLNASMAWESHQILTHVATKLAEQVPNHPILSSLKDLKLDKLKLVNTTELGLEYTEIIIPDQPLPFRLRLDEHGKLWFAPLNHQNKTTWHKINNLTQFDDLVRKQLNIDSGSTTPYASQEDQLLSRFATTKEIMQEDLLSRYLRLTLRSKYGYTDEELLVIDISPIIDKLYISQNGIKHSNHFAPLTQAEFNQILDHWHSNEKVKQSLSEAKKYQVAAESILGFVSGSLLSLSGIDQDTLKAALVSSVALSGAAKVIATSARALTKNSSSVVKQAITVLENIAEHASLVSGWALLGFGLTESVNPSSTTSASAAFISDTPLNQGPIDTPELNNLPEAPTIVELPIPPQAPLIPLNFSDLTDAELLNHFRTTLGDSNWVNTGPFLNYSGRPVELADVLVRAVSANRGNFTPSEVAAVHQIAKTNSLVELNQLIREGLYQTIFGN